MSMLAARIHSKRFQKTAFWLSLLVLAAGVIAVLAVFVGQNSPAQAPLNTAVAPKDVSKTPPTVKLEPAARQVAKQFILTAVARRDLRAAYALAGPEIKQGQSLQQWLTGDIAVIPYPVSALDFAPMKIDYSYPNEAMIEVALLPKPGSKIKPQLFQMVLDKVGKRWVVNSWVPGGKPPVPCGDAGNC